MAAKQVGIESGNKLVVLFNKADVPVVPDTLLETLFRDVRANALLMDMAQICVIQAKFDKKDFGHAYQYLRDLMTYKDQIGKGAWVSIHGLDRIWQKVHDRYVADPSRVMTEWISENTAELPLLALEPSDPRYAEAHLRAIAYDTSGNVTNPATGKPICTLVTIRDRINSDPAVQKALKSSHPQAALKDLFCHDWIPAMRDEQIEQMRKTILAEAALKKLQSQPAVPHIVRGQGRIPLRLVPNGSAA